MDPSAQGHLLYDGNSHILPTLLPIGLYSSLRVTVPPSLLVSEFEVLKYLNNLSSNKAPGPDETSNQIFKVFAPELAPVIRAIYNLSLRGHLSQAH